MLVTYPIDLARTVLAVSVANDGAERAVRRVGVATTLVGIARHEGVASIYRGMYPTMVGVVPYAGISFLTFGVLKRAADRRQLSHHAPIFTSLVCGGSAGLCTLHVRFFMSCAWFVLLSQGEQGARSCG